MHGELRGVEMRTSDGSHRRGEVHVGAVHLWCLQLGPASGDDLAASVELDALGPVEVLVPEQGRLPAAEGVEGHRDQDGNVDADHAGLDVTLEFASPRPAVSEDGGAVTERTVVDE